MIDVVHIGNATLYHADCFDTLPGICGVDALITDPPYGCTRNTWDKKIDLTLFWQVLLPIIKHNAACCVFSQMPFSVDLVQSNRKMFRYDLVYEKSIASGYLNANRMPLRSHELICVFYRALPTYNPQKVPGKPYMRSKHRFSTNYDRNIERTPTYNENGMRYPTSVVHIKSEARLPGKKTVFHPTQKPLSLMEWLIKTYTNPGEIVLDPFMGSGSTGIAAIKNDRRFIGIEREEEYFLAACQRMRDCIAKDDPAINNQAECTNCGERDYLYRWEQKEKALEDAP